MEGRSHLEENHLYGIGLRSSKKLIWKHMSESIFAAPLIPSLEAS